jgi:NADH-quinone oxidoreductase subunit N
MLESIATISNELILVVLAGAVISLGLGAAKKSEGKAEVILTSAGLLALIILSFAGLMPFRSAFGEAYRVGPVEALFKRVFLLAGLFMTLLSWPSRRKAEVLPYGEMGECLGLMLLSLTGMCFLVSARELILLYVGLELVTMPLILLVALNRHELRSVEAGMKYVFFAALSSGLLLYGLSLVYGMTGTTFLSEIAPKLAFTPLTVAALLLVMGGVGFKISAVPFHLWTPDTYEGAPVTVTAFLSVASKAAGFALFYKVIAEAFGSMRDSAVILTAILAAVTMTFGNLVALHQTNLKRFLAFSSIAQAGYLMIGLTHSQELGLASVTYYLLVYLVSNMAAFGVVTLLAAGTGREDMREYVGLSETNPRLALVMMLAMFSLAGIPPLAGFLGKFYLFAAAAEQGLYWLVFVGAINATVSLYYYLIVVKWMYIMKPSAGQEQIEPIKVPWAGSMVLVSTTAAMVLIGVLPQVIRWAESAAAAGLY